ncbi:alpha/beta hydrolase [Chryseolinea sp. H1M3-3]|uniref:alpha/beta hydrolase n=1 Tax=Chryseolinea sp. H1M3-3 TaxID=3034144 RepID=UPI0023ED02B5|nr:alpha/beta hydrolase [Chryseolinea sp. H1M3-3]
MFPTKLSLLFFFATSIALYGQTDSLFLWPNKVPGETKPKSAPVPTTLEDGSIRVVEVTNPFLAVFEPKASDKNGKAVVVCPGGGYVRLAVHKEGYAIADWLTKLGYTVFVLHYRVPDKRDGALQDLQRSLKLIRQNAALYGIDAKRIGAMGFSAGAHVVARAGMTSTTQRYPTQDDSDEQSGTPDRMIIIYPGYLSGGPNRSLTPELQATGETVDTFIFQTMDDASAPSALALATALQNAKANVELHMLPKGGHGYGMYPGNIAAETWPKLLEVWLKEHL